MCQINVVKRSVKQVCGNRRLFNRCAKRACGRCVETGLWIEVYIELVFPE